MTGGIRPTVRPWDRVAQGRDLAEMESRYGNPIGRDMVIVQTMDLFGVADSGAPPVALIAANVTADYLFIARAKPMITDFTPALLYTFPGAAAIGTHIGIYELAYSVQRGLVCKLVTGAFGQGVSDGSGGASVALVPGRTPQLSRAKAYGIGVIFKAAPGAGVTIGGYLGYAAIPTAKPGVYTIRHAAPFASGLPTEFAVTDTDLSGTVIWATASEYSDLITGSAVLPRLSGVY